MDERAEGKSRKVEEPDSAGYEQLETRGFPCLKFLVQCVAPRARERRIGANEGLLDDSSAVSSYRLAALRQVTGNLVNQDSHSESVKPDEITD